MPTPRGQLRRGLFSPGGPVRGRPTRRARRAGDTSEHADPGTVHAGARRQMRDPAHSTTHPVIPVTKSSVSGERQRGATVAASEVRRCVPMCCSGSRSCSAPPSSRCRASRQPMPGRAQDALRCRQPGTAQTSRVMASSMGKTSSSWPATSASGARRHAGPSPATSITTAASTATIWDTCSGRHTRHTGRTRRPPTRRRSPTPTSHRPARTPGSRSRCSPTTSIPTATPCISPRPVPGVSARRRSAPMA